MAEADRSLVVVGAFADDVHRRIEEAASEVGLSTAFVARCEDTPLALASVDAVAIVLRLDAPGAAQACAHVRAQARCTQVPILGATPERNDLAFTELFSWGGDDLFSGSSARSLVRRLRPLVSRVQGEPKRRDGCALVAGADARWRRVMGRALYQGGFTVRFVANGTELREECIAESVRVVVVLDDLMAEGPEPALAVARAAGSRAAWIVVAPPKRMAALHAAIGSLGHTTVADGYAPPENVLFLTNELLSRRGVDQRASARVLYGTSVAFRAAGRDEDEIGFSYNVSAGGVYVRTLDPLDAGQEVWLEMWPPRSERRVRLAGTVAWKRAFGPSDGATVPTGFGVKITEGLAGDLDRWQTGYQVFAASVLGSPTTLRRGP